MMKVLVLFGGQSTEHDISRKSVITFLNNLNQDKYDVYPVGITKEGKWLLHQGSMEAITDNTWIETGIPAILSPDATTKGLLVSRNGAYETIEIDVIVPVLHGKNGEDGTIQGLFKLADLPFVGCGVLSSAVAMDKVYTKQVVEKIQIRQADYVVAYRDAYKQEDIRKAVDEKLGYPVFVKPSCAGSSIGVSKAVDDESLHQAVLLAFKHDRKVLIEENIVGREVECAVFGNTEVLASDVGEILAADEFYDFDSKYNNADSKTIVGAPMPEETRALVREYAVKIFKAIDGRGLSRVDFFIEEGTGGVIFNEINTLPGFTAISMYPMLMMDQGYDLEKLMDGLIDLAIKEYAAEH